MLLEAFAILVMLLILSVLIIVHEFGHFLVARYFGFQTPVFGFGLPFGPYKVIGHKWGTEFRAYAAVLGGFVAIPELGDETNAREENFGVPLKPFRKFPIWQRALVAFAGVGFNILFAWIVMYTMLGAFGEPSQAVIVKQMPADNPVAANAGVKVNDQVWKVDNTLIASPDDIVTYLGHRPNTPVVVHVKRDGNNVDIPMTTNDHGKVGMALVSQGAMHYTKLDKNPIELIGFTTQKLWHYMVSMVDAMGMMFSGIGNSLMGHHHAANGQPSMGLDDLHGVLAVIKIGADIAKQDWSQLLMFTIMISLDLAIVNLVPWPALDGGHLAMMAIEAVRGKPMEERTNAELTKWGFVSLLLLMAVIMCNDVYALFTGKLDLKKDKPDTPAKQNAPTPNGTPAAK